MRKLAALQFVLALVLGLAFGIAGYTFYYASGNAYLTNDPAACANCHVMQEQYDSWIKSSHRAVATCNDCHTPVNFFGKYQTKMTNGIKHSYYFTFGGFPEPIQITSGSLAIAEKNCRHCHQDIVAAIDGPHNSKGQTDASNCTGCHGSVGHPNKE